ncbi:discoidin domain-containing protein [Cohnella silvisoli]|uniref:Discoidin domain-containing protein n=1 Tax=Cohnella silvisoli TaxID=2873699 RepID=A0ABV1KUK6_9BACL|nr:discoidin domain-containing protein [Cohnella silvisoli]MCD9023154.1 discoidin domain-containing protein [Cohnella silvisoli]
MLVLTLASGGLSASAAGTGSFEIGGYWQPPIFVGADYNTMANWANIANAHIDNVMGLRIPSGQTANKTNNESGIANSYANNVKLYATDSQIYDKRVFTSADIASLQSLLTPYKNDSRVKAIDLRDEPNATDMEGIANTYKQAKAFAPNLDFYVNLLPVFAVPDTQAPPGKLFLSNSAARGNGSYVSPGNSLGQTITIPAGITYLHGIDMYIDSLQWTSGETLTLKLWNSTAKTSLISQASIAGTGSSTAADFYRYFNLYANVTPGSTYYIELVHSGGGDNQVGWVVRSSGDTYSGGTGYENGIAKTYDFFFRLYTTRTNAGTSYENYVDDWVQYSGANYILYDNYPFKGGYDDSTHFLNAEAIRGRGLANDVLYGGFLQGIEIRTSTGVQTYRSPTVNQMRWNVYSLLPYGYKKMNWFTYWRPDDGGGSEFFYNTAVDFDGTLLPRYSAIQTLNAEMRNLGNTLKDLTSVRVYHSGSSLWTGTTAVPNDFFVKPLDSTQPMIEGYFTNAAGRKYIMLSNRDYISARTVSFQLNPKPSDLTEISKTTGLEVAVPGYNASTGIVTLTFSEGEGKLFALPIGFSPYDNLAAEAKVTATSSYESTADDGWGVSKANDDKRGSGTINGVKSSGWSSTNNLGSDHTESITFDLGASKTVGEVNLFPRGGGGIFFPIDFNIQIAQNAGGPWTTVVTKTNYPASTTGQWFPFTPATARYVKIEGTKLRPVGSEYRMQLAEVEIYASPNYARGASLSATSSAEFPNSWGLSGLNDQIRNSVYTAPGWSSNSNLSANHTESVTLNLQSVKTFSRVDLYPRNDKDNIGLGFPIDFTIQVANSASGPWTTVVSQTGYAQPTGTVQSFSFASQSAQYVKIQGTNLRQILTESGSPYRMQLAEIEIH